MQKDYLTPFQVGASVGESATRSKMAQDELDMRKSQFQQENEAAGAINAVYQEEAQTTQKRAAGAKILSQFRNLSAQSPSVRKATAPVIFDAMEQAGLPVADNMKQFVMSGKSEEVTPVVDRMIRLYAGDPNHTVDDLAPILGNPLKASEAIGVLSRQEAAAQQKAEITGPAPNPRRDKFNEVKASRERQISRLEQVVAKYGNTKTADVAQQKITQLRSELEKMETLVTGNEATSMGVRPGTTLTENGMGNVAVLQGPDDSGGGGGAAGIKATDERYLRTLAAAPYDNEVNLQTGEINFKNRADEVAANAVTAKATRIYVNAGGKLTLSEAYQEAVKKGGGGSPAGVVDPVTGQPKNHFSQYDGR